jgi:NTP pyrophosphatase (non-canonical NTP hydrolase)
MSDKPNALPSSASEGTGTPILPCPFCGKEAHILGPVSFDTYDAVCGSLTHPLVFMRGPLDVVVAAWNRRALPSPESAGASMSIREMQRINAERSKRWMGTSVGWTVLEVAGELAGEVGELANVCKKLRRSQMGVPGNKVSDAELLKQATSEAADVFIVLMLTASKLGIDLERAVCDTFNAKSEQMGFPERMPLRVPPVASSGKVPPTCNDCGGELELGGSFTHCRHCVRLRHIEHLLNQVAPSPEGCETSSRFRPAHNTVHVSPSVGEAKTAEPTIVDRALRRIDRWADETEAGRPWMMDGHEAAALAVALHAERAASDLLRQKNAETLKALDRAEGERDEAHKERAKVEAERTTLAVRMYDCAVENGLLDSSRADSPSILVCEALTASRSECAALRAQRDSALSSLKAVRDEIERPLTPPLTIYSLSLHIADLLAILDRAIAQQEGA